MAHARALHARVHDVLAPALLPEPLTQPTDMQVFPPRRPDLFKRYKQAVASFWVAEAIDLSADAADYEKLSEGARHFVRHVLAFFAQVDVLVFDNTRCFWDEVTDQSAKLFYGFQVFMEGVHSEVYQQLIQALLKDEERAATMRAIETMPVIAAKAAWVKKWMDPTLPFGVRVLAFAIVERVTFCAAFASIAWLRKQNVMPGLATANQYIARDEGMHADFGVALLNDHVANKPSAETAAAMLREAIAIEDAFVSESLPVRLLGMNCDEMQAYIRFVGDHLMTALKYRTLYGATNPFPWMADVTDGDSKGNFFEVKVTAYAIAGVGGDAASRVFATDADF